MHKSSLEGQLAYIVRGGEVQRFHALRTQRSESVAEHSFMVSMLVWLISPTMPRSVLLLAALTHDLPEWVTGDIPAPTKRRLGVDNAVSLLEEEVAMSYDMDYASDITKEEAVLLKTADNLSGLLFCAREKAAGNNLVTKVYHRYKSYLEAMELNRSAREAFEVIQKLWTEGDFDVSE